MLYPILKRVLDVLGAGFGLLLFLPAGIVIALVIKVSDGGPVFYGQVRVGRHGKPFKIWKFRSMVPNADRVGVAITQGADPRITRIGRWLRGTKMDELPQLWNVFVGEMSLVGPRPEVPQYVALYTETQREILEQRPGITDVASLSFRDEEALLAGASDVEGFYVKYCLPRKIALNREYQAQASLVGDLGVVARTLGLMMSRVTRRRAESPYRAGDHHPAGDREGPGAVHPAPRVAVVGAGEAGRRLADRFLDAGDVEVVAFFDDDAHAWHGVHRGVPVVGMPECLLNATWKQRVDAVGLALEGDSGGRAEELKRTFEAAGFTIATRDGVREKVGSP